jgi:hypothetical protein
VADWYDEHVAWSTAAAAPVVARLAGRGSGWCLDVGCGTGVHLTALAEMGWSVVGADASADQLRLGLHPCFTGPFAEQPRADGARVVHPGYARPGWRTGGPGSVAGGLTSRVGFRHLPIARALSDVLEADLRICHVEEAGTTELPEWLALLAQA